MPFRTNSVTKVTVDGKPVSVFIVDRPTVEDVLVVEARLFAAELMNGKTEPHRVSRDVRELLLRLGIDR